MWGPWFDNPINVDKVLHLFINITRHKQHNNIPPSKTYHLITIILVLYLNIIYYHNSLWGQLSRIVSRYHIQSCVIAIAIDIDFRSFCIRWCSWRSTVRHQVSAVEQEMYTLPEPPSSLAHFYEVLIAKSSVFCAVFWAQIFVLFPFLLPLYCVFFFQLRLLANLCTFRLFLQR